MSPLSELVASPSLNMLVLAAVGLILYAMLPEIRLYRKRPEHAAAADLRAPASQGCESGIGVIHAALTGDIHLGIISAVGAVLAWVQVGQILHARRLPKVNDAGRDARPKHNDDGHG